MHNMLSSVNNMTMRHLTTTAAVAKPADCTALEILEAKNSIQTISHDLLVCHVHIMYAT